MARWLNELALYPVRFKYVPGETQVVAEAVSRNTNFVPDQLPSFIPLSSIMSQMQEAANPDEEYQFYVQKKKLSLVQQIVQGYDEDPIFSTLKIF